MIEKIKYIIFLVLGGLVSYWYGILTGKRRQKENQQKEVLKNVKKVNTINNSSNDTIDSLHDRYE